MTTLNNEQAIEYADMMLKATENLLDKIYGVDKSTVGHEIMRELTTYEFDGIGDINDIAERARNLMHDMQEKYKLWVMFH